MGTSRVLSLITSPSLICHAPIMLPFYGRKTMDNQLQTLLTLLSMLADVVMSYQPYMEHWFWFKYADLP